MKRFVAFSLLSVFVFSAYSQGYVGAVRSLSNIDFHCSDDVDCHKSGQAWRFYGGMRLAPGAAIDLGVGRIDAIEVAYMRFGSARSGGTRTVSVFDVNLGIVDVVKDVAYKAQADALSASLVARFPVVDDLNVLGRLGVAYVSSTLRTDVGGMSDTSQTATKLKPYAGLGVEYEIPSVMKIIGSIDWTRYDVAGRSGSMRMIGVGAETSF